MVAVVTQPLGTADPNVARVHATASEYIGTITLDSNTNRNALSEVLLTQLIAALEDFRTKQVRAVVLRAAAGADVWSAGRDITELPRGHADPLGYADPLERALRAVRSFPAPVVAMVHGSVWSGAFDLALSCDMIIADETASFAVTPVNLGVPYNTTGLLHFLGRLPLNLVRELFFTAASINAEEAARWGVVNHLVPSAELERFTFSLAKGIASKAPLAIAVIKEQLRVLTDYQPIAAQVFERLQEMRRWVYDSKDYVEGINAFLEKRRPVFRGE
jgi:methylmalonyl-CoA decarboxylase